MSEVMLQVAQELPEIAAVGLARGRALSALALKVRKPPKHRVTQVIAQRQFRVTGQNVIERFGHFQPVAIRTVIPGSR